MNIVKLQYNNRTILTSGRDSFIAFNMPSDLTLNPMNSWYIPSASRTSVSFSDTNTVKFHVH